MQSSETNRFFWKLAIAVFVGSTALAYAPALIGRVPLPTADIFEFPMFMRSAPPGFGATDVVRLGDIGDLVTQFYPYRTLAARAIRDRSLPMWNPYMLSGTTFLGNPLSALFYPPNALYYVLPTAIAWTLGFLLRSFLGGLFTAMFVRRIGGSTTGSIAAGLLFTFNGFMTVWQGQTPIDALIWLPLICYAIVRLHTDSSKVSIAILAFALAMLALAGHPETCVHVSLLAITLVIFLAFQSSSPSRFIRGFLVAGILSVGIAAIQLAPSVEWFLNAHRGLEGIWPAAPLWSILGLVSRDIVSAGHSQNSFGLQLPTQAAYIGMLGFLAAPIALLSASRKFVAFFTVWSVFALSAAYRIGPALDILQRTPLLKTIKHDRLVVIFIFGLAVLAGLGISVLDEIESRKLSERISAGILSAAGLCAVAALIYLVHLITLTIPDALRTPKASLGFLFAGEAIIIGRLIVRHSRPWFSPALLIFICCDVCTFAYGFVPFAKPRNIFPDNEIFSRIAKFEGPPFRISQVGACFPANAQLMYGLYDSSGYEIPLARIKRFTDGIALDDADSVTFITKAVLQNRDRRIDMLNTKYLLVSEWDPLYMEFRKRPDRFRLVFSDADTDVFENLRVLPAAHLVPVAGIEVIPEDEKQLQRIKDPGFDAESHVVLASASTDRVQHAPAPVITTPSVQWTARKLNSFEMDVNTSSSSFLVVSQMDYPGWKALVDGQPVEIRRANYAFPAIFVTPGSHHVRFFFDPWTFKLGLALTVITVLILGVMVFREIRRTAKNRI